MEYYNKGMHDVLLHRSGSRRVLRALVLGIFMSLFYLIGEALVVRADSSRILNEGDETVQLARNRYGIHTDVVIDGQPVPHVTVHTGSAITIVYRDIAEQIGLQPFATRPIVNDEGFGELGVAMVERLEIGPKVYESCLVFISPEKSIVLPTGEVIGGALGMDLLGQQPFTLDFRRATLTFHDASAFTPPGAIEFPLQSKVDTPRVRGTIEGCEGWFEIDVSYGGAVLLSSPFVVLNPELVRDRPVINEKHHWSEPAAEYKVRWDSFSFLGRTIHEEHGAYRAEYHVADVAGTIGSLRFRDAAITIDMATRRIWPLWYDLESLDQFMKRASDPEWHDLSGMTPLLYAALLGRDDAIESLLHVGANPNEADAWGFTPLMVSAARGDVNAVSALLDQRARPNMQSSFDAYTPLAYASVYGRLGTVRQLLTSGANPNQALESGRTPLFLAAEAGHPEIMRRLLEHDADVDRMLPTGETALIAACRSGITESISELLNHGANPNALGRHGTALIYAVRYGTPEAVRLLLNAGARPDLAAPTGESPLLAAVITDADLDILQLLLDAGADPMAKCEEGRTPVDYAVEFGSPEKVQLLLERTNQQTR